MNKKALAIALFTIMIFSTISILGNSPLTRNEALNNSINSMRLNKSSNIKFYANELPYELNILFDEAHDQYFDSSRLSDFLNDLKKEFGATITINTDPLDTIALSDYSLIILTNPASEKLLTKDENAALQNYLENNNGTIFVMATFSFGSNHFFIEPSLNFTEKYGIGWYYDAEVKDNTTYYERNYYPIVHNWANTTVAGFLSNQSDFKVAFPGTAIKIIGSNDSSKTIYRVGCGDNDTYLEFTNGSKLYLYKDLNYFSAVDLTNGGRIFASGSSEFLRNDFYSYYNNKPFALRIIHWLLSEGLEITTFEAPSELYVGETGYVNFTIRNNEAVTATNVQIGIELSNGLGLKNASNTFVVGNLAPGEEKSFSWMINGTLETISNFTVKVWCDNLPGFSKAAEVKVKLPSIELKAIAKPNRILLSLRNNFTLEITAYAPRIFDADNVIINITLPEGLSTDQSTTINVGYMSAGEVLKFDLVVNCSTKGVFEITITSQGDYSGGSLKVFTAVVEVYVYDLMILFDQGHDQYYDADRMYDLIDLLYDWGYVYINNGTIVEENLTRADIVILPNPEAPLSDEEISLIKNYVNNGGALIITGTFYKYLNTTCMNSITQEYGIKWEKGLLWDTDANIGGNVNITKLSTFSEAIIAQVLLKDVTYLAFSYSTYLNVSGEAIPIIYGNPTTKVNTSEGLLDINDEDIIAGAVYQNNEGGKILALGSTGVLAYLGTDETKFVENILNWVLGSKIYEDTTTPTIEISPLENQYISATEVTISWDATDNKEISYFVIYLDGNLETIVDSSVNEYTFSDLSDGNHVARVYAVDIASLFSYDEISFTIDTNAPTINVVSPEPGSSVYAGEIPLVFNLSDESGILKVEIYIDGQLNKTIENPGNNVETSIYIEELGDHTITIVAYDLAGNMNSKIIDITVVEKPSPGPGPTGINIYYILIASIIVVGAIVGYVVYSRRK